LKYRSVSFLLSKGDEILAVGAFARTMLSFTLYAPGPGLLETFSKAPLAVLLAIDVKPVTLGLTLLCWSLY
jgi:hypothetical protein